MTRRPLRTLSAVRLFRTSLLALLSSAGCDTESVTAPEMPATTGGIPADVSSVAGTPTTDCGLDCAAQANAVPATTPTAEVTDTSTGQSPMVSAECGSESFRAIYQDIFRDATHSCTAPACHGRTMRLEDVGNLDLSTADLAYGQLVDVGSDSEMCAGKPRVIPGNPQGSLLVTKLRDATVECGLLMPVGAPIDDPSLMRIVNWIGAGACNN